MSMVEREAQWTVARDVSELIPPSDYDCLCFHLCYVVVVFFCHASFICHPFCNALLLMFLRIEMLLSNNRFL